MTKNFQQVTALEPLHCITEAIVYIAVMPSCLQQLHFVVEVIWNSMFCLKL